MEYVTKDEIETFVNLEEQTSKAAIARLSEFMSTIFNIHMRVCDAIEAKTLDIGKANPLNYSKKLFKVALLEAGCSDNFVNRNMAIVGKSKAQEIFGASTVGEVQLNLAKKGIETQEQLVETLAKLSPPSKKKQPRKVTSSKDALHACIKAVDNLDLEDTKTLRAVCDKKLSATRPSDSSHITKVKVRKTEKKTGTNG